MPVNHPELTLTQLAKAGFSDFSAAKERLVELGTAVSIAPASLAENFRDAADPDSALQLVLQYAERNPVGLAALDGVQWQLLVKLFGASEGIAAFWLRHSGALPEVLAAGGRLRSPEEYRGALTQAIEATTTAAMPILTPELQAQLQQNPALAASQQTVQVRPGESGWIALRVRYRQLLTEIMLADLAAPDPVEVLADTARALSDLADAALEAALLVARATLAAGGGTGLPIPVEHALQTPLSIIAMGKCGARELNVVSDVDVLFITEPVENDACNLAGDALLKAATRLAGETMRAISAPAFEPPLWEVDANLRPEGKNGPLVRTLESYLSYYEKWAQSWEFQALLKARFAAGQKALGAQFISAVTPMVWASKDRPDFVGSVQRMRERVTEHIDTSDIDHQIKLGPGGLRDIEFSVQLLQLVHGANDPSLRSAATLESLAALVAGGYVSRIDGEQLAHAYKQLRVWEHRLQQRQLRRTALMPRDPESLRLLARASGWQTAEALTGEWEKLKVLVRQLHLKIFYAPLLSAVARLQDADLALTSDAAAARLASIGFRDPAGALRHLTALTEGSSRRAQIQRHLLPVLLQWLGDGTNPDAGLLAFRRISEANANAPWYLRLLRDGAEAAQRLTTVLAGSKYAATLLERMPESVAWLERDERLASLPLKTIVDEMHAVAGRRDSLAEAAKAIRGVHRREVLRLALARLVGLADEAESAAGLDGAHTALLRATLAQVQRFDADGAQVAVSLIAMGRYGGGELGFASDLDLIAVYRAHDSVGDPAGAALRIISALRQHAADPLNGVELDFDLRPEGKNGVMVRNLEGYRTYYEKWSLTWETQALLRARFVAGDAELGGDFMRLADEIRYPKEFSESQLREVRTLKARMETERLPRGVQPRRHLKLGPGGVSDVEWLVQLWQLQYAHGDPALQTTRTLDALDAAVAAGHCNAQDALQLRQAWELASRLRSATMLWAGRGSDVLPADRDELEGINRILGAAAGTTTELEESWLGVSRRARAVFEENFFGPL